MAAKNGHDDIVAMLLHAGGFKMWRDGDALPIAGKNGHLGVVNLLLNDENFEADYKDALDRTALSYAAEYGHLGVVQALLQSGHVNPNSRSEYEKGRTPLSFAAGNGHTDVVRHLVDNFHTDPELRDDRGKSPLHWATEGKYEATMTILQRKRTAIGQMLGIATTRLEASLTSKTLQHQRTCPTGQILTQRLRDTQLTFGLTTFFEPCHNTCTLCEAIVDTRAGARLNPPRANTDLPFLISVHASRNGAKLQVKCDAQNVDLEPFDALDICTTISTTSKPNSHFHNLCHVARHRRSSKPVTSVSDLMIGRMLVTPGGNGLPYEHIHRMLTRSVDQVSLNFIDRRAVLVDVSSNAAFEAAKS